MPTFIEHLAGKACAQQSKAALSSAMARNAAANGRRQLARIHQNKAWAAHLEASFYRDELHATLATERRLALSL